MHQEDLNRPVSDFITPVETWVRADWTVQEALENLRTRQIQHPITYFYVVDQEHRLKGVLPARGLLLSPGNTPLAELVSTKLVTIPQDSSLAEAMEDFAIHRLLALPVVDGQGRLLGIIDVQLYAEEAVDLAEANRLADLFQLIGLSAKDLRKGGVWPALNSRLPWLMGNVVSGLLCAGIAAIFKPVLASYLLLAMFIPLVLTLSESVSMQSMTLTLQYLHGSSAPLRKLKRRLNVEWRTAALLGLACGMVAAVTASFWSSSLAPAGIIGLSICLSMLFSGMLGAGAPILLHLLRLDPRLAGGPVVLMLSDVLTTALYLGLATWLLL
jgi:magnesium transporter